MKTFIVEVPKTVHKIGTSVWSFQIKLNHVPRIGDFIMFDDCYNRVVSISHVEDSPAVIQCLPANRPDILEIFHQMGYGIDTSQIKEDMRVAPTDGDLDIRVSDVGSSYA